MRINNRELLIEKYIPPTQIDEAGDKLWYNEYGELHNINDQPAAIYHNDEGEVWWMEWWRNGVEYRKDGKPNEITYRKNNIRMVEWINNERKHRDGDKPAAIRYGEDGKIERKSYYKNGVRNRDRNKPAVIYYNYEGKAWRMEWHKNGKFIKEKT